MKIIYDPEKNTITGNKYSIGTSYGAEWKRKPIYLINCRCGCPLVAYFNGAPPYKDMGEYGMTASGYGGNYKYVRYTSKGAQGWGFAIRSDQHCPECRRDLFIGATAYAAVYEWVKKTLFIHDEKIREKKIIALVDKLKKDPEIASIFSFQTDVFSKRNDCILTIDDNHNERFKKALASMGLDCDKSKSWIDSQPDVTDHTELEADILAAHGEDCTCSLCME